MGHICKERKSGGGGLICGRCAEAENWGFWHRRVETGRGARRGSSLHQRSLFTSGDRIKVGGLGWGLIFPADLHV